MSLALQSLVALTLLVSGAVAVLPLLLQDPAPVALEGNGPGPVAEDRLRLVESAAGRWFLNGEPIGRPALVVLLRQQANEPMVEYLPSSALAVGHVRRSLTWLRRNGAPAALLALPAVER